MTSMINEDRFFRAGVARLFTGSVWEFLNELIQNAQRSQALHVRFSFPTPSTCVVQDDGHGLIDGPESLQKLLMFSESGFANPQVEENQRPLGMGLYAVITNQHIERIRIESYSSNCEKTLVFEMETQRWLSDGAYRNTWQERVILRDVQEGDHGFRLTLVGKDALIEEIRSCLLDTPAQRIQTNRGGMNTHWVQHRMSPACGYDDLLEIFVDEQPLDLRLPEVITTQNMQFWCTLFLSFLTRLSCLPDGYEPACILALSH